MSDEATCHHCGGRISYDRAWAHDWLSSAPPYADLRVPPHAAWPYLHAHQRWRNGRRDSERTRALPWDEPDFTVSHPGARIARALAWLRETFGAPSAAVGVDG